MKITFTFVGILAVIFVVAYTLAQIFSILAETVHILESFV